MTNILKRINRLWARVAPWLGITATGIWLIIITPLAWVYAYQMRGYNAVGGEALMPLFPLIVWVIAASAKEMFKESEADEQ